MSDLENCEDIVSGDRAPPRKKSRSFYRQPFNLNWLNDESFKAWLQPDKTDRYTAICKVCDTKLKQPNKSGLLMHKDSAKHKKNSAAKLKTSDISSFFKSTQETSQQEKVIKAELLLAGFMAEHRTPFRQSDHLVKTLKAAFPDSAIAQKKSLGKSKASYVMQHGIAWNERQDIDSICKEKFFSILIDETTDIAVEQVLGIVVRYLDENSAKVVDALLDVVEVVDASGQGLYTLVKQLLLERGIPLSNIIGFASDNCASMTGSRSGFQAKLKEDVPSVFVIGCVCHSFALCANHACSRLPSWLESFLKNVCFYFCRSSKRKHTFIRLQEMCGAVKHKMLKLSQTRWLSRRQVIARVLEQWEPLKCFFLEESRTDKVDGASSIYETMNTPGTKHMLLFLHFVLKKVDNMNLEFQSEEFRLHQIFNTIADEYRCILSLFIKESIVDSSQLGDINPANPNNYKLYDEISVGGRCEAMLLQDPLGRKEEKFRMDILSYLVELCNQIKMRFSFSDNSILAQLRAVDPKIATSRSRKMKSLVALAIKFPSVVDDSDLDDLQEEWGALPQACNALHDIDDLSPPEFWLKLKMVKNGNGQPRFKTLAKMMCCLLALPHSTACVERLFSQVNMVKTKLTNSMHASTVANRLLAKQAITRNNTECYSWKPTKNLIADAKAKKPHQRYVKSFPENENCDAVYDIYTEPDKLL